MSERWTRCLPGDENELWYGVGGVLEVSKSDEWKVDGGVCR